MADSPPSEHALGEEGIRALLKATAPELAALPLTAVAEGWDNATWRLGDERAVRIPRRRSAVPLILHEARALPEIGPRLAALGIRTPIPLVIGSPSRNFPWPWSVVPWIEGANVFGVDRSANARWAGTFAAALHALHLAAPADAPRNPVRGVPLRARDEVMQDRLALLPDRGAIHDAWAEGLDADVNTERVWIHGDLHPGNVLTDGGELVAIIDFGDVTAGDPAYDLAASWLLFDAAGRAMFRAAAGDRYDDATWTRARAWAAYLALVFLTQSDDRPDHLAVGVSTARELGRD